MQTDEIPVRPEGPLCRAAARRKLPRPEPDLRSTRVAKCPGQALMDGWRLAKARLRYTLRFGGRSRNKETEAAAQAACPTLTFGLRPRAVPRAGQTGVGHRRGSALRKSGIQKVPTP